MHLRIYTFIYLAILFGFATAAQSNVQRNSDLIFNDEDAEIEGSGNDREVAHDLESSGSGYGPDDEDTDENTPNVFVKKPPATQPPHIKTEHTELEKPNTEDKALPTPTDDGVIIMNGKPEDRPTSFFAQPGILAAIVGGAVVGLLCAILVVMFIVYRMRKKDEGSYALGEPKQSPTVNSYSRGNNKEFYA